jgi:hypothetical protein
MALQIGNAQDDPLYQQQQQAAPIEEVPPQF